MPFRSAESMASDFRPTLPRLAPSDVTEGSEIDGHRQAGYGHAPASAGFSKRSGAGNPVATPVGKEFPEKSET